MTVAELMGVLAKCSADSEVILYVSALDSRLRERGDFLLLEAEDVCRSGMTRGAVISVKVTLDNEGGG